jgi:hypothetical protein
LDDRPRGAEDVSRCGHCEGWRDHQDRGSNNKVSKPIFSALGVESQWSRRGVVRISVLRSRIVEGQVRVGVISARDRAFYGRGVTVHNRALFYVHCLTTCDSSPDSHLIASRRSTNAEATMSGKYAFTKSLKEVRFLFCQTSEHSGPTRWVFALILEGVFGGLG